MASAPSTAAISPRSATPSGSRRRLACEAEDLVVGALQAQRWEIIGRNLRGVGFELDIVATRGGTLAIVEVKARRGRVEDPLALLGPRKVRALARGAAWIVTTRALIPTTIRIDLALVETPRGGLRPTIRYLANAVEVGEG